MTRFASTLRRRDLGFAWSRCCVSGPMLTWRPSAVYRVQGTQNPLRWQQQVRVSKRSIKRMEKSPFSNFGFSTRPSVHKPQNLPEYPAVIKVFMIYSVFSTSFVGDMVENIAMQPRRASSDVTQWSGLLNLGPQPR